MRSHGEAFASDLQPIIDRMPDGIDRLDNAALGVELVEIRRSIDRLESVFSRALGRFNKAREFSGDGATSTVSWLRWKCRLAPGAAVERVAVAEHLPELPQTEAALAGGDLGFQHAALIARCAGQIGHEPVRAAEPILLEAASRLDPRRFSQVTAHLRHCEDADGFLSVAQQAYDRRRLSLSQSLDGVFHLEGLLDAEGGTALQVALNALSKPLPGDDRSATMRRADALVELSRRQLDGGDLPEVGGVKPHLTVTCSLETLAGVEGSPAGDLEWGQAIPGETVRRLACDR